MKLLNILLALPLLWFITGCAGGEQGTENRFHGMWKLDRIESFDKAKGLWYDDPFFEGWEGYILYDGKGHMAAEIVPKGYRDFDADRDPDSLNIEGLKQMVAFFRSNFVYFANYRVNGKTVEHARVIATNPKDWGSLLKRDFEFRSDTLLLIPHEILWGRQSRLRWIRQ